MVKYLDNNSGFAQWNANKNATAKKSTFGGFLWWFILLFAAMWAFGAFKAPKTETPTTESDVVVDLSAVPTHDVASEKLNATVQTFNPTSVTPGKYVTHFTKDGTTVNATTAYVQIPVGSATAPTSVASIWVE